MPEYEVIYAPIVLDDDQNFFDQSPFSELVETVASNVRIDAWRVRYQINYASFKYGGKIFKMDERSWYQHPSQKISRLMMELQDPFTKEALLRLEVAKGVDPGVFLGSFIKTGEKLEKYPHWAEYVVTQKPPGYSPSGDHKDNKGFLYKESYPSWVMRRLVKTKLNEVRGVFPEFFSAGSPYLETPNINSPRPILRWTIPLEKQEVKVSGI